MAIKVSYPPKTGSPIIIISINIYINIIIRRMAEMKAQIDDLELDNVELALKRGFVIHLRICTIVIIKSL